MRSLHDHQRVQKYLLQVTRDIRKRQVRADIQEELLCHIESEVERLQAEGMDLDEAIGVALERLGSPDGLCNSFFRIYHYTWRSILKFAGGVAFCASMVGVWYITTEIKTAEEKQQQYVAGILPYVESYLDDLAELEQTGIFAPVTKNKDAGEYLNPRVQWAISSDNPHLKSRKSANDGIYIPAFPGMDAETILRMHVEGLTQFMWNNEIEKGAKAALDSWMTDVDLGWMRVLLEYDHWDLYKTGSFSDYSDSEAITWNGSNGEVPMPYLNNFKTVVLLRLIRGEKNGDSAQALKEVQHLARLLYSTETMQGATAAVDIYEMADNYVNRSGDRCCLARSGETSTFPPAVTFKARRAVEATPVFMSYNMMRNPEIFHKIFGRANLPPAACGAFLKTVNMARMKRNSIYTLDGTADETYTRNNSLLYDHLKTACRLPFFRENLTAEEWAKNLRAVEIPKHDFINDMKIQNWGIWGYWYVMKWALKIPHVRNTYTRYIASDNYPYFPTEYHEWNKYSKNINQDKSH